MSTNIFEQATRLKLRFKATNGQVTTEDLWGLSLDSLNTIGVALRKELRETEDSLISESKTDSTIQLRFDVVKHIIDVKMKERDEKREAAAAKEREKVLLEEMENRQKGKVQTMSDADLQKELAELRARQRAA